MMITKTEIDGLTVTVKRRGDWNPDVEYKYVASINSMGEDSLMLRFDGGDAPPVTFDILATLSDHWGTTNIVVDEDGDIVIENVTQNYPTAELTERALKEIEESLRYHQSRVGTVLPNLIKQSQAHIESLTKQRDELLREMGEIEDEQDDDSEVSNE
jgi:hypothetical protein